MRREMQDMHARNEREIEQRRKELRAVRPDLFPGEGGHAVKTQI
jgi:hypothetical protein